LPGGSTELRIRNDAAVSLVAFVISVKMVNGASDAPLILYNDSTIDAAVGPVLPNQERIVQPERIHLRAGSKPFAIFEQPMITGGVFSDGTTTGDPVLLSRLMLRWSNMLLAVETALETLSDAGRHNVPSSAD
jgi:hypothetical protein